MEALLEFLEMSLGLDDDIWVLFFFFLSNQLSKEMIVISMIVQKNQPDDDLNDLTQFEMR